MDIETPALSAANYDHARCRTLARWIAAKASSKGVVDARETFHRRWPRAIGGDLIERHKAPVGAGTLPIGSPPDLSAAFIRTVTPLTALGRLEPRRVPFNLALDVATPTTGFSWAASGTPFRATALTFTPGDALDALTAGGILALTREAVELGANGAEQFVIDELGRSYVAWLDDALLNSAYTAIPGERPASITSGATPIGSAGSSPANMIEDGRRLVASYTGQGGHLQTAVVILAPETAVALRLSGGDAFRNLTATGGDYAGVRAVVSEGAGAQIVLLDQSAFYLADEGQADLDVSTAATVQMVDAPTQDGTAGTGSVNVSLYQNNLVGVRLTRTLNWEARGAVAVVSGVSYAAAGSPA